MRRSGFTLIELLIIVAVIGAMLAMAVGSVTAGMETSQMAAAGRTVVQFVRHARTVALLQQRPCVITYADGGDGEDAAVVIKVELQADASGDQVQSVKNVYLPAYDDDEEAFDSDNAKGKRADGLADVMNFMEKRFEGLRIRVEKLGMDGKAYDSNEGKSAISVFSNVDYLLAETRRRRAEEERKRSGKNDDPFDDSGDHASGDAAAEEPVSITYEPNGRTEAHRVTLYRPGTDPDADGLTIEVDLFGKPVVE
ncbi:MAG: prepilin-type N-terminal cleavage/methylation domain-containing protein [Kiritimatiellae bacterium]|nr:prepilin-type N-terminal cleavage/methylation domain-containing protein [Kiritimatiellia bacterium]